MTGVCGVATSVQGVRVVCDRVQGHAGAHRSTEHAGPHGKQDVLW